jgi:hypothetical protein
MTSTEKWRPIPGYEGLYEISSEGRVKKLARTVTRSWRGRGVPYQATERELVLRPDASGSRFRYPRVVLYGEGKRSGNKTGVARLVLLAFGGEAAAESAIEYRDGDSENVALANLISHEIERPGEYWRPIPGWEDHYEVSSLGRVRSRPRRVLQDRDGIVRHHAARIMKTYLIQSSGYPALVLQAPGRTKRRSPVHQYVCEAFHGLRPPGAEVCHRDGDRENARADNLYWGTKAENTRDKIITGFADLAGITAAEAEALILTLRRERLAA